MAGFFKSNVPAGQPAPGSQAFQRIPEPGSADAQDQITVYSGFYGQMPMPATQFATSTTTLKSLEVVPSVRTVASNASVVQRANRRNGMVSIGGRKSRDNADPPMNKPVRSSLFQEWLIGPQINFSMNDCLYRAGYPAATISYGTMRNLGLSTRVDQLPTRTTGGPGPAAMLPAPAFRSVQTVPRYSTMPSMYPTESSPG